MFNAWENLWDTIKFGTNIFSYFQVMFCHDHQNRHTECERGTACRFIHCTRLEEEEYRRSGYLPPYIRDQVGESFFEGQSIIPLTKYSISSNKMINVSHQSLRCFRQSIKEYRATFPLFLEPGRSAKIIWKISASENPTADLGNYLFVKTNGSYNKSQ